MLATPRTHREGIELSERIIRPTAVSIARMIQSFGLSIRCLETILAIIAASRRVVDSTRRKLRATLAGSRRARRLTTATLIRDRATVRIA
jgi:hypothetical protein